MENPSKKAEILTKISFNDFHKFSMRHIGPSDDEQKEMLKTLDLKSLDELIAKTVPASIRVRAPIQVEEIESETAVLARLKKISLKNKVYRSLIGLGYSDAITPNVILRNILEVVFVFSKPERIVRLL